MTASKAEKGLGLGREITDWAFLFVVVQIPSMPAHAGAAAI